MPISWDGCSWDGDVEGLLRDAMAAAGVGESACLVPLAAGQQFHLQLENELRSATGLKRSGVE